MNTPNSAPIDDFLSGVFASDKPKPFDYGDLRILDKRQQLVPLALNRVQRNLLANLTGRDLILKARQQGVSTALQAHLFRTAVSQTARVGTLAHDDETTKKLRDMAQTFYDELPAERKPARDINNATRTYYPDTKSMVYIATAGNRSAGRGGTYSHVHGSEVAFWKDATKLLSGLMQGVPTDGHVYLESTPNGAQGWFYQQCMNALDGKGIWTLHFYPWWWDDGYQLPAPVNMVYTSDERALVERHGLTPEQIAWRRYKQDELGIDFIQEYPEDPRSCFLQSGAGFFTLRDSTFTAPADVPFMAGHRYVAGLDWGQSNDYTVCCVLNATTGEQVALLRLRKLPYADMRARVLDLCAEWNVSLVVAESNSMGSTNIEELYVEADARGMVDLAISAKATTAQSKRAMIMGLHAALERGDLRLLDDGEQAHELRTFEARQTGAGNWQYGAPNGEHDDCVMALALAWHGAASGVMVLGGN